MDDNRPSIRPPDVRGKVDWAQKLRDLNEGLNSVQAVMQHLLWHADRTLLSDAIVARTRGMIDSLARQLLDPAAKPSTADSSAKSVANLADRLRQDAALVLHCHALAVEWQLTEKLAHTHGVDPVLSRSAQALIASPDDRVSALAVQAMAAQSRFVQHQRRMSVSLGDLPGSLFQTCLVHLSELKDPDAGYRIDASMVDQHRRAYDEGKGRSVLLARLFDASRHATPIGLMPKDAGVALFLTALSQLAGETRERVCLSATNQQSGRLAVAMRAAGFASQDIDQALTQLLDSGWTLNPTELTSEEAKELLRGSNGRHGDLQ